MKINTLTIGLMCAILTKASLTTEDTNWLSQTISSQQNNTKSEDESSGEFIPSEEIMVFRAEYQRESEALDLELVKPTQNLIEDFKSKNADQSKNYFYTNPEKQFSIEWTNIRYFKSLSTHNKQQLRNILTRKFSAENTQGMDKYPITTYYYLAEYLRFLCASPAEIARILELDIDVIPCIFFTLDLVKSYRVLNFEVESSDSSF